jgi:hypothetical protein
VLLREGKLVTSYGSVLQKLFSYLMLARQQKNMKESKSQIINPTPSKNPELRYTLQQPLAMTTVYSNLVVRVLCLFFG